MPAAGRSGTDGFDLSMRLPGWVPALLQTYHQMTLRRAEQRGQGFEEGRRVFLNRT